MAWCFFANNLKTGEFPYLLQTKILMEFVEKIKNGDIMESESINNLFFLIN